MRATSEDVSVATAEMMAGSTAVVEQTSSMLTCVAEGTSVADAAPPETIVRMPDANGVKRAKTNKYPAKQIGPKQLAYLRLGRTGGWGLLGASIAGVIAAVVSTRLPPWAMVQVGLAFGSALEYLGFMPSSYRRRRLTVWADYYDNLLTRRQITEEQRQQLMVVLLHKYTP